MFGTLRVTKVTSEDIAVVVLLAGAAAGGSGAG
jgi:hypothetical protein